MNIIFKRLTMQNFLSVGNAPVSVELDTDLTTLILGDNRDGSEGSRNGVGKTTIFNAIAFVLFDQTLMDIKKDGVVNVQNSKNCVVTLDFEVDGITLQLTRGRKPNVLKLTKDGEPFTPARGSVEAISDLIGMDFELFTNVVMLSNESPAFHKMKGADQKTFVENLLNIDILTERANVLKESQKDNAVAIRVEQTNQTNHNNNMAAVQRSINDLRTEQGGWQYRNATARKALVDRKVQLELVDVEAHRKARETDEGFKARLADINVNINAGKAQLEWHMQRVAMAQNDLRVQDSQLTSVVSAQRGHEVEKQRIDDQAKHLKQRELDTERSITQYEQQLVMIDQQVAATHESIVKIDEELAALAHGSCPVCSGPYVDNNRGKALESSRQAAQTKLEQLANQRRTITETITTQRELRGSFQPQIDELLAKKPAIDLLIQTAETAKAPIVEEQARIRALISELNGQTADIESAILPLLSQEASIQQEHNRFKTNFPRILTEAELAEISTEIRGIVERINEIDANNVDPYAGQIEALTAQLIPFDTTQLTQMEKNDEHYKILIKVLTDSKSFVRKAIVDMYIPFINAKIAEYLSILESPHTVLINNDLSVDVDYLGTGLSYGNLSRGEKLRVDLATAFAFRDFVQSTGTKTNLLCVDELLDSGIDAAGMYAAYKLLRGTGASTFLISHREELITRVDRIMTVIKERGFSRIETCSSTAPVHET